MSENIESEIEIISPTQPELLQTEVTKGVPYFKLIRTILFVTGLATLTITGSPMKVVGANVNPQQFATSTECFQITPGEWVKLIHVDSPNYSNTHQEKCPTPVPVSLDPNAPQDRYSQLFNQIATGKASEEEIIEFNTEANKRNTVENDPKIDGLTAVPYVIGNTPAEYKQVTGYINNTTRQLVAYFDNGSLVQISK